VELRQLAYFVAVAEEHNFTRASAKLFVAQPAVSRQVDHLERELGARLFERMPRDVRLTSAGEALLPRARDALAAALLAREEVAASVGVLRGRLVVGCLFAAPRLGVPGLLTAFRRAHPGIETSFSEAVSERLVADVRDGTLDVAFVSAGREEWPPGLATELVDREPALLLVCSDHPFARRTDVSVSDLCAEPFIVLRQGTGYQMMIDAACGCAGFEPDVVLEAREVEMLTDVVGNGLAVTFVPQSMLPSDTRVCAIRVDDPPLECRVSLLWRTEKPAASPVAAFVALARDHFGRAAIPRA
jgi:DNA-binding transcriptional LysR family regulator